MLKESLIGRVVKMDNSTIDPINFLFYARYICSDPVNNVFDIVPEISTLLVLCEITHSRRLCQLCNHEGSGTTEGDTRGDGIHENRQLEY